jgi:hypothetical protein
MTVEEVARDVLAAVDSDANFLLACNWISNRYRQLCSRARFKHLRKVGQLFMPATIQAGTISVTKGSNLITTTDPVTIAAFQAQVNDITGRWIRAHINWMEVIDSEIGSASATLKLSAPFVEDSNAVTTYQLCHKFISLAPHCRFIGPYMIVQKLNTTIRNMSLAEMDVLYPRRAVVSGVGPLVWAEIGVDKDQNKVIELYPYASVDMVIMYVYWPDPPTLSVDDPMPGDVDSYVLREGALIDAMRYEAAKAAKAGNNEMAAFWSNSYRAQSTQWERNIIEAIRNDRGADDITLLMRSSTQRYSFPRDVVTGRDEVYVRGMRP